MNSLPKPVLALIISFSFSNRAVCRRWRDSVKYTFKPTDFDRIVKFGTESVLRLFLTQHPTADWSEGLCCACAAGNEDMVRMMIQCGAQNWDQGLFASCVGGRESLALAMIRRGASDLSGGLYAACIGGHESLARLMIVLGANIFHEGLYSACTGNNTNLVHLMISHGANDWTCGLYAACVRGNEEHVRLMLDGGAIVNIPIKFAARDHKNILALLENYGK